MLASKKLEQKDVEWIIEEITRLGGIDEARTWIDRYVQKALKMLKPLPNKPEKKILTDLALRLESY